MITQQKSVWAGRTKGFVSFTGWQQGEQLKQSLGVSWPRTRHFTAAIPLMLRDIYLRISFTHDQCFPAFLFSFFPPDNTKLDFKGQVHCTIEGPIGIHSSSSGCSLTLITMSGSFFPPWTLNLFSHFTSCPRMCKCVVKDSSSVLMDDGRRSRCSWQ